MKAYRCSTFSAEKIVLLTFSGIYFHISMSEEIVYLRKLVYVIIFACITTCQLIFLEWRERFACICIEEISHVCPVQTINRISSVLSLLEIALRQRLLGQ